MTTYGSARDEHGEMTHIEADDPRLGRVYIEDRRDADYPMRQVLPEIPAGSGPGKTWRYWWPNGWWGNQGSTPQCVSFAWHHWTEDGPRTREPYEAGAGPDRQVVGRAYHWMQRHDRWPGEDYGGTSVRAGAKWMRRKGFIEEYRWASGVDEIIDALLTRGPVVMGTWWYRSMYEPDSDGFVRVQGDPVGGHAYLLNGVNTEKGFVRGKNSWGRAWGDEGYFRVPLHDLRTLFNRQGEACLPVPKGGR